MRIVQAPMPEGMGEFETGMLDSADLQSQFNEYSDLLEVEEVGSDTIDGVDVTEYAVTADVEAALEMMGMSEQLPEEVRSMRSRTRSSSTTMR